jgi:Zn2+/Cd2+-exporting ATPase
LSEAAVCPGCENEQTDVFAVQGLCCAAEVALVEGGLAKVPGVCSVRASAVTGKATVVHTLDRGAVEQALAGIGFRARAAEADAPRAVRPAVPVAALALTAAGAAAGFFSTAVAIPLYAAAIGIGGAPIARTGWQRLRQGSLDMNVLMTIAVAGAMAIGEWGEGASTVVLFSLAQLLEARSLDRARRAISGLLSLAPETALVRRKGVEERVAAAGVARGEHIFVKPGERVPLDGVVVAGASDLDQSPLTGESRPVPRGEGDGVFAGSINGAGALEVRVTRLSGETTLARVLRRVEEAQSSRAPSQGFVEAFARVYTPAVVALAALLAVAPPLLGYGTLAEWAYRALVLLVIACPCALVISTPVSIVSALTAASRRGILVKGGAHLEEIGRVREVVFDKTGTLTRGRPRVADVIALEAGGEDEVVSLAASVESRGAHPIGEALVAYALESGVPLREVTDVKVVPGRGVRGRVDGTPVVLGSHRFFDELGLCDHRVDAELLRLENEGKTVVLVGREAPTARLMGVIAVGDVVRPEAAQAVADLAALGVDASMLTGDNERTARAIAAQVGIRSWAADLLPEDKVERLKRRRAEKGRVAMVGDGVNDAPALATANVGIALGGRGTDAALETADVALMSDDLGLLAPLVSLGRATRRTIAQNIAFSLIVKAAVLGLALAGYGTLWAAVAADMGASMLVIGNGLRLLRRAPADIDRATFTARTA